MKSIIATGILCLFFSGIGLQAQQINDNRFQANIRMLDASLQKILRLEPISYQYDQTLGKKIGLPQDTQYGFSSGSIQDAFPGMLARKPINIPAGKNRYQTLQVEDIDLKKLIPVLVAAIQEQQQEIERLKGILERTGMR